MGIFRANDIRGIYPDEINEEIAENIGRAFGTFLLKIQPQSKNVVVAGDVRTSTKQLKQSLIKGIISTGLNVTDIGITPTPVFYFSITNYGFDGGVMVTASHLGPEYNGFKLCKSHSICLRDETGIKEIENIVKNGDFISNKEGSVCTKNVENDYISFVSSKVNIKPLKVVVDAGNGTTGNILPKILENFGCKVIKLFCEPDGTFPNHIPDPLVKENMKHLQEKIVETNADLGIAMDNDGDRCGFVDNKGNIIENNHILCWLAKHTLERERGKIVFDLLCSDVVAETIKKHGGIPLETRVGHSFIQATLINEKCVLGGETSGHYYFPEMFNCDDGIFAALKIIECINRDGFEFLDTLPKYFISEDIRIPVKDDVKFEYIEKLTQVFTEKKYKMNTMDGVKVYLNGGWFCIRASNTQPAIVIRFEGKTKEMYDKIQGIVKEALNKLGLDTSKIK